MPLTVDILITETLQELNPREELNRLLAEEGDRRIELDQF